MLRNLSLQARVALLLMVFALALSTTLAVFLAVVLERMEHHYIDSMLELTLDMTAREAGLESGSLERAGVAMTYLMEPGAEAALPAHLAGLGPGFYEREVGDQEFQIGVRDVAGKHLIAVYDSTVLEATEERFDAGLVAGVLLFGALASAFGYWLAGIVTEPVSRLATQVIGHDGSGSGLRLHFDRGGKEVRNLAEALQRYSDRVTEFIRREKAFTADVSHELRNPIMAASASLDVLNDLPDVDARFHAPLARIRRSVSRMSELVDAFLELAREQQRAAAADRTDLDVTAIVHEVVARHADAARAKGITLTADVRAHPVARGRHSMVAIVLDNLIGNAIRHSSRGTVTVTVDNRGVTVQDEGPGIPLAEQPRLFDAGFRGERAEGSGFGRGLSIVARVCEHAEWNVEIESGPSTGTSAALRF